MTICPNGVQYVAVSTTASPVMHVAETAVNAAAAHERGLEGSDGQSTSSEDGCGLQLLGTLRTGAGDAQAESAGSVLTATLGLSGKVTTLRFSLDSGDDTLSHASNATVILYDPPLSDQLRFFSLESQSSQQVHSHCLACIGVQHEQRNWIHICVRRTPAPFARSIVHTCNLVATETRRKDGPRHPLSGIWAVLAGNS